MHSKDDDKTIVGGMALDLSYSIDSEKGEKFIITDETVVGRGTESGILIEDKKISRKHALLKIVSGRLQVTDLESSNGTFVNGEKITKPSSLSNGDVVSFEKHIFTVNISMNDHKEHIEVDDEHTAVMDFTEEQLEKLHQKPIEKVKEEPIEKVKEEPVEKVKEEPVEKVKEEPKESIQIEESKSKNDPVLKQKQIEKESVPSSWIEESGAAEGTRMLDMSELHALRAGAKEVIQNDSQVTRLHCFIGAKNEEIVELPIIDFAQASGWEIGRDSSCDIVIDHPSVSNRHAQIIHQNGRWKIVNLVSTNGILINGQKRLSTYLSDGDKIAMGSVSLVLKIPKSNQKSIKKSVQKPTKKAKNTLIVPAILGLIIVILMVVIFFYIK